MKKMYRSSALLIVLLVISSIAASAAAPPPSRVVRQAGCVDCPPAGVSGQRLLPIQREIMRLLAERHAADLATAGTREMQPNFCFAPGTPESYIRSVSGQMGGIGKHFRVDDEPGHWEFTATDGANIPRGDAITLTWSIVPDETHIPQFSAGNGAAANSTLRARLDVLYGNEGVWMPLFQQVFDRWEELTGITYVHEPNDDMADFTNGTTNGDSDTPGVLGVRADIRIGGRPIDGDSNTLAFNFGPPTGDMVIDTDDDAIEDMANNSRLFRNMVSHEHGHGLGINHVCPINNTKIMEPIVSRDFDGPQFDDIRAGQRQHGDPMENNDTFAQATNLGVVSDGTITANTVLNGAFLSLDGSDDVDIFKFNVSAPGKTASLTLRPIGSTYLEGAQNPDGSCTVGTTFNSLIVKNLGIELISSDASTVLASADVNGAGQTESIVTIPLPGGTGPFFVRVFGGAVDSVQLYEFDLAVAAGSSGALDHFAIETIATPQGVNQTFAVTLNAEDIFNGPAASFNGTVNLSLLARESILIAEIDPGTTDRVEFCNVSERTVDISGWQIVIYDATSGATPASTTTLSAFSSIAPGGVFTLTEDGVASGNLPNLSSGSGIDWSHNSGAITILLLNAGGGIVDFATLGDSSAFSNPVAIPADEWMGPGITDSGSDTYQRTGSADTSTASDWSSAAQTFGSKNVGLSSPFPARPIAFSPTTTGAFSSGMRMETLTFTEPGDKVVLRADDAAGHIGYSNPFDLELVDDISVWLTAVPSSVRAGETITYTATVQNTGPSGATGVMLMDMLPANTAFVSASASQGSVMHDAGSPGTVTANLGALAGGGTATVTINITSSVTGTLMNTVSVARGEADSFAPNNTASASVLIVDGPDNVEEFNAFPGFSGSFSSNPTVANDVGGEFEFLNFGSGETTEATGFGLDTVMSQNGRGLTFEAGEGSGMWSAADISPGDYTVNSHMIAFWFKFTDNTANGASHSTHIITVFNQNAPDNGAYAYSFGVGVDINSIQGVGMTLPRAGGANTTYAFTGAAPDVWHQAILHYTSASDTMTEDGSLNVWIDPAGGSDAPDLVFNMAGDAMTSRVVGPFGRYGFGQVLFTADSLGPDVAVDSIGTWDGFGTAGVNDVQAGVDFLNSSIPNLAIAAVSASKAEGNSGNTAFDFTVTRTGPNDVATTVDFAVTGSGANTAAAADFGGALPSGSVSFAAGETSQAVTINASGDTTVEPDEGFTVTISVPGGGAVINVPTATGTIQNDDQEFDFGDAPDPAFPTLLVSDGARHSLSGPFLGASRDADANGQPDSNATGDDLDGNDDDDGVTFTTVLRAGDTANVTVNASAAGGRLNAWIDFDGDGSWADAGEQIFTDEVLVPGNNLLSFSVPANAAIGDAFARFRISTQSGLAFTGVAPDGEVEDYRVTIAMNAVPVANAGGDLTPVVGQTVSLMGVGMDSDMGDALSFAWDFDYDGMTFNVDAATQNAMTGYPSPGVRVVALRVTDSLGALHIDMATVSVGKANTATTLLSSPNPSDSGTQVTLMATVTVSNPGVGTATGAVVFKEGANTLGSGTLNGSGVATLNSSQLPVGALSLTAEYQGDANFNTSASTPLSHTVNALLDFGDAPDPLVSTAGQYPTLLANDGARHRIVAGAPRLGTEIDAEADGQPDPSASSDDGTGSPDDENGVMIPTLVLGATANIQVEVTGAAGKLDAWIDFNQNGVWESPAEQIAVNMAVGVGMHTLIVPVNQATSTGPTFARFRVSTQGELAPTGEAADGEVEDHRLIVIAAAPPTANHIASPKPDVGGDVDLVFSGTPGVFYQVQASSDLQLWITIVTVQADGNGVVFHKESGVGAMPVRFYRVFEPAED